ncbi:DUF3237 domain-containing protein [Asticcacaulis sp.]|uniref:DUF3237 domain-containing protein n=1 Tax=Asticcacaulis sp. TaxID=1872648 RepID=UPI003F7CCD16
MTRLIARFGRLCAAAIAGIVWLALPAQAQTSEPLAPHLEFVFEETVRLGEGVNPGPTPMGERYIIPITGGTFDGPGDGAGFKGIVRPGGWDWQLKRADGCVWATADYMLQTDDGAVINVRNQGPMCPQTASESAPILLTPIFEAPLGRYQWLNQSAFVARLGIVTQDGKPAVKIRFYRAR